MQQKNCLILLKNAIFSGFFLYFKLFLSGKHRKFAILLSGCLFS